MNNIFSLIPVGLGPYVLTESQIFSHLTRPKLFNKHFIYNDQEVLKILDLNRTQLHTSGRSRVLDRTAFFRTSSHQPVRPYTHQFSLWFTIGLRERGRIQQKLRKNHRYGSYNNKLYVSAYSCYDVKHRKS